MQTPLKIFWLITLMFFPTGCSGYRVAGHSLLEVPPEEQQDTENATNIKFGDSIHRAKNNRGEFNDYDGAHFGRTVLIVGGATLAKE